MLYSASRFLTGLFLLQSLITRGPVYTSSWRSVTLSAGSSLGKSPELPWLILDLQLLCCCKCKELHNFPWAEQHTLSKNSTITCPPFDRTINNLNCPPRTSLQQYHVEKKKKSPYSWVYQDNNYICENIFRQRLRSWGLVLNGKAKVWKIFPYRPARQVWKAFSTW